MPTKSRTLILLFFLTLTVNAFGAPKIDPLEILPNTVDRFEFGALNGVRTNLQYQIDTATGTATQASTDASWATNWIATNALSYRISMLEGRSNTWNQSSIDASAYTNWISTNSWGYQISVLQNQTNNIAFKNKVNLFSMPQTFNAKVTNNAAVSIMVDSVEGSVALGIGEYSAVRHNLWIDPYGGVYDVYGSNIIAMQAAAPAFKLSGLNKKWQVNFDGTTGRDLMNYQASTNAAQIIANSKVAELSNTINYVAWDQASVDASYATNWIRTNSLTHYTDANVTNVLAQGLAEDLRIGASGSGIFLVTSTGVVVNANTAGVVDFMVHGDDQRNLIFVDVGSERIWFAASSLCPSNGLYTPTFGTALDRWSQGWFSAIDASNVSIAYAWVTNLYVTNIVCKSIDIEGSSLTMNGIPIIYTNENGEIKVQTDDIDTDSVSTRYIYAKDSASKLILLGGPATSTSTVWSLTSGGDHSGADWTITVDTTVAGTHFNIGTFTINSACTAIVNRYVSDTNYGGRFSVNADNIVINGGIRADGAGYPGGNAGGGGSGSLADPSWIGYGGSGFGLSGTNGQPYDPLINKGMGGNGIAGFGPFGGAAGNTNVHPRGYGGSYNAIPTGLSYVPTNVIESQNYNLYMGSGGGGGGGQTAILPGGGHGAGAGVSGGGAIYLYARNEIIVSDVAEITCKGKPAGDGIAGNTVTGKGGNGGGNLATGSSNGGGAGANFDGGSGSGGGVLFSAKTVIISNALVDVDGYSTQTSPYVAADGSIKIFYETSLYTNTSCVFNFGQFYQYNAPIPDIVTNQGAGLYLYATDNLLSGKAILAGDGSCGSVELQSQTNISFTSGGSNGWDIALDGSLVPKRSNTVNVGLEELPVASIHTYEIDISGALRVNDTNVMDYVDSQVADISNTVNYAAWDQASTNASYATNWISTNALSYRVSMLEGRTGAWNQASVNASAYTNWISTNTYVKMESDPYLFAWLGTNTYYKNQIQLYRLDGKWLGNYGSNVYAAIIASGTYTGNCTVVIPAGDFYISAYAGIEISNNVSIVGAGRGVTTIREALTGTVSLWIDGTNTISSLTWDAADDYAFFVYQGRLNLIDVECLDTVDANDANDSIYAYNSKLGTVMSTVGEGYFYPSYTEYSLDLSNPVTNTPQDSLAIINSMRDFQGRSLTNVGIGLFTNIETRSINISGDSLTMNGTRIIYTNVLGKSEISVDRINACTGSFTNDAATFFVTLSTQVVFTGSSGFQIIPFDSVSNDTRNAWDPVLFRYDAGDKLGIWEISGVSGLVGLGNQKHERISIQHITDGGVTTNEIARQVVFAAFDDPAPAPSVSALGQVYVHHTGEYFQVGIYNGDGLGTAEKIDGGSLNVTIFQGKYLGR